MLKLNRFLHCRKFLLCSKRTVPCQTEIKKLKPQSDRQFFFFVPPASVATEFSRGAPPDVNIVLLLQMRSDAALPDAMIHYALFRSRLRTDPVREERPRVFQPRPSSGQFGFRLDSNCECDCKETASRSHTGQVSVCLVSCGGKQGCLGSSFLQTGDPGTPQETADGDAGSDRNLARAGSAGTADVWRECGRFGGTRGASLMYGPLRDS